MNEELISRLMHHVQCMDFELSRSHGLDIAMMKSIIDQKIRFIFHWSDDVDEPFVKLNGKNWVSFSPEYLFDWIPLWNREQAINVFNCLVSSKLIECMGDIDNGEVLIHADIKTAGKN